MPELSILIPHKHSAHNDAALKIAVDCIISNTRCDYELLIDTTTPADPYTIYNAMAKKAAAQWIVFGNSDVFFAPGWDVSLRDAKANFRIVTGVLVECGAIGVSDRNVHRDFGRTPQTFRRVDFEAWAAEQTTFRDTGGWYFPCMINRMVFNHIGGFDTTQGAFPTPLDGVFWDNWRGFGNEIKQVASYAYHLQNYSDEERTKEARVNG